MDFTFGELEELLDIISKCSNGLSDVPNIEIFQGVMSFSNCLSNKYPNRHSMLYKGSQVPEEDVLKFRPLYEMFHKWWKENRGEELLSLDQTYRDCGRHKFFLA